MSSDPVLYREQGGVAHITLNRPRRGNAMNMAVVEGVVAAVERAEAAASVRVVVLAGAGKYFCTGMDLSASAQRGVRGDTAAFTAAFLGMCGRLQAMAKPLVARVHGPALGGGIVLLFLADVRLMAHDAYLQFSEAKRGLVPAMISTFIVPQIGAFHARELFLTGRRLPAARCDRLGMLTEVASPPGRTLDGLVGEYCAHLLSSAPRASAACKRLVDFVAAHGHAENLEEARRVFSDCVRGDEAKYGTQCFREKRQPDWSTLAQSKL